MRRILVFAFTALVAGSLMAGRRTLLAIGDSITAAQMWQQRAGEVLDWNVRSHCRGGIGILAMVDGDAQLKRLAPADVAGVDAVILMGFYNERASVMRPASRGTGKDLYPAQNTFCGRLNHAVKRVREELALAQNANCPIILVAPHGYGKYPWIDCTSETDGEAMLSAIREVASANRLPCIDLLHKGGVNRSNWSQYQASAKPLSANYLTADGTPNTGVNKPFATLADAPSAALNAGKWITVKGAHGSFRSDGKVWKPTPTPFPWNADQLHMSRAGYRKIGEVIAREMAALVPGATIPETRTARLHDAKWGVFNHFLSWGCNTPEEWNRKVDGFNVEKLADQLTRCGARFYFITLMQGRPYLCAPNATFDRIAGTRPGEACSRRDLPAEIAKALKKRNIDLYLYYTGDGPYMDRTIGGRFGFVEPREKGVTRPFVEKWASVLQEYAVRYGAEVKGWWIDGCYADFLKYTDPLLCLYADAVQRGNPAALVAMNNGVKPEILKYCSRDTFTCGEFNDFTVLPTSRLVDDAQSFVLIPLGKSRNGTPWGRWAQGGCHRDAAFVADYVDLFNRAGGAVAIDVKVNPDGSFEPDQLAVLEAVGRKTGTLSMRVR